MTLALGIKPGPYDLSGPSAQEAWETHVWKARDTRLGCIAAIKKVKVRHSERLQNGSRSTPTRATKARCESAACMKPGVSEANGIRRLQACARCISNSKRPGNGVYWGKSAIKKTRSNTR